MAHQAQQSPRPHFWDLTTSSCVKIAMLYNKGHQYQYEDVVWHAWKAICDLYFPKVAATPFGSRWSVDRETSSGLPPNDSRRTKPDLTVIKMTPTLLFQPPQFVSRDYLWIKCKAAVKDTPGGWKDTLEEAVTHLTGAHPYRKVFLIIAVGWKCMYFVWDPLDQAEGQLQLFIRYSDIPQPCLMDRRIKAVESTSWVDPTTGEISCGNAMELECWTTVAVARENILRNEASLAMIVRFLLGIQKIPLL